MSSIETRQHQIFPVLDAAQIAIARRFASGPERRFEADEAVFRIGERNAPAWLVLEGELVVMRRDGLNEEVPVVRYAPGQFSGEINQLASRPAIASGHAGPEGCTALPFDPAHLRALTVGSAELGEIIMRALILRRVELIEHESSGIVLIGNPDSPAVVRLQEFLARSAYPSLVLDASAEGEGRDVVERLGVLADELPLVVCPDGTVLRNPTERELATALGMLSPLPAGAAFDVAIVGAGPAGLAAAVYAASEGLSVIVFDERASGGQAGASARIENYLGFPTGISGRALAGRALSQAMKFGAEISVPLKVARLDCSDDGHALELDGGERVRPKAVVIASGAHYRRPAIPDLATFEGNGVSYWASPIEARLCAGEEVALVGGGNSAGQAIAFLAPQVKKLDVCVRRPLEQTMSRYLVERIAALPNVEIHVGCEVQALEGDRQSGLTGAIFRATDGSTLHRQLRHLFLFIGADPHTGWLEGCVEMDDKGFIITGAGGQPLETSLAGVFAIGDVRVGSTKRVAAAVGEGAAVVAQIHAMLAEASARQNA